MSDKETQMKNKCREERYILQRFGTNGADPHDRWVLTLSHDEWTAIQTISRSTSDPDPACVPLLEFRTMMDEEGTAHVIFEDYRHSDSQPLVHINTFPTYTGGCLKIEVASCVLIYVFPGEDFLVLHQFGEDPKLVQVPEVCGIEN